MSRSGALSAHHDSAYRRDIDGLRAIAVTSVVLYHAGLAFLPGGFVGVDIFFVISGYLIGGILLREVGESRFKFTEFYARRARRILPALIAVVLATCAFGVIFLSSIELKMLGSSAASALGGVSNIRFWLSNGYFTPDAHLDPMLMTWSLGVEEQFYVVFPFLLLALAKLSQQARMIVLAGLAVVSFAAAQVMIGADPQAAFYLLPARAWELAVGALLASVHMAHGSVLKSRQWLIEAQGVFGLVLLAASIATFNEHTPVPGWPMIAPVIGTAMLLDSRGSSVNRVLLSAGPMVFIGLISYSWYLWHWPLMTFARIASLEAPPQFATLTLAAISFVLAIATWRWIERPFRHRTLPAPSILWRYAAAGLIAVSAPAVLRLSNGWSQRLPMATLTIENTIDQGRGACHLDYGVTNILRSEECTPGPKGKAAIALMGDSHASALTAGMAALAGDQDVRLIVYAKSSCTPLVGVTVQEPLRPAHAGECARYLRSVVNEVAADPDIKLVVLTSYWSTAGLVVIDGSNAPLDPKVALEIGLNAMIDELHNAGKEVVVIGDVPRMNFDVARYATGLTLPLRRAVMSVLINTPGLTAETVGEDLTVSAVKKTNQQVREIVDRREDASFLDLFGQFCLEQSCRFSSQGELWYFDKHHLSKLGSLHAVEDLRRRLAAADRPLLAKAWAR